MAYFSPINIIIRDRLKDKRGESPAPSPAPAPAPSYRPAPNYNYARPQIGPQMPGPGRENMYLPMPQMQQGPRLPSYMPMLGHTLDFQGRAPQNLYTPPQQSGPQEQPYLPTIMRDPVTPNLRAEFEKGREAQRAAGMGWEANIQPYEPITNASEALGFVARSFGKNTGMFGEVTNKPYEPVVKLEGAAKPFQPLASAAEILPTPLMPFFAAKGILGGEGGAAAAAYNKLSDAVPVINSLRSNVFEPIGSALQLMDELTASTARQVGLEMFGKYAIPTDADFSKPDWLEEYRQSRQPDMSLEAQSQRWLNAYPDYLKLPQWQRMFLEVAIPLSMPNMPWAMGPDNITGYVKRAASDFLNTDVIPSPGLAQRGREGFWSAISQYGPFRRTTKTVADFDLNDAQMAANAMIDPLITDGMVDVGEAIGAIQTFITRTDLPPGMKKAAEAINRVDFDFMDSVRIAELTGGKVDAAEFIDDLYKQARYQRYIDDDLFKNVKAVKAGEASAELTVPWQEWLMNPLKTVEAELFLRTPRYAIKNAATYYGQALAGYGFSPRLDVPEAMSVASHFPTPNNLKGKVRDINVDVDSMANYINPPGAVSDFFSKIPVWGSWSKKMRQISTQNPYLGEEPLRFHGYSKALPRVWGDLWTGSPSGWLSGDYNLRPPLPNLPNGTPLPDDIAREADGIIRTALEWSPTRKRLLDLFQGRTISVSNLAPTSSRLDMNEMDFVQQIVDDAMRMADDVEERMSLIRNGIERVKLELREMDAHMQLQDPSPVRPANLEMNPQRMGEQLGAQVDMTHEEDAQLTAQVIDNYNDAIGGFLDWIAQDFERPNLLNAFGKTWNDILRHWTDSYMGADDLRRTYRSRIANGGDANTLWPEYFSLRRGHWADRQAGLVDVVERGKQYIDEVAQGLRQADVYDDPLDFMAYAVKQMADADDIPFEIRVFKNRTNALNARLRAWQTAGDAYRAGNKEALAWYVGAVQEEMRVSKRAVAFIDSKRPMARFDPKGWNELSEKLWNRLTSKIEDIYQEFRLAVELGGDAPSYITGRGTADEALDAAIKPTVKPRQETRPPNFQATDGPGGVNQIIEEYGRPDKLRGLADEAGISTASESGIPADQHLLNAINERLKYEGLPTLPVTGNGENILRNMSDEQYRAAQDEMMQRAWSRKTGEPYKVGQPRLPEVMDSQADRLPKVQETFPERMNRESVRNGFIHQFGVNEQQADDLLATMDARARRWGKLTGRDPLDWYPEHIAGFRQVDATTGEGFLYQSGQSPTIGPLWYSEMENVIGGAKQTKMPARQWWDWLKKQPGVKADEMRWSGVDDWLLSRGTERVTQDELLDFMRANEVQVDEVLRGPAPGYSRTEHQRLLDGLQQAQEEYANLSWEYNSRMAQEVRRPVYEARQFMGTDSWGVWDFEADNWATGRLSEQAAKRRADDWHATMARRNPYRAEASWQQELGSRMAEARTRIREYDNQLAKITDNAEPRFNSGNLVTPGGENYRELLLTLPNAPGREGKTLAAMFDPTFPEQTTTYPAYQSPHWSEPNVLAHVRFNERTMPDGTRVLFVEEFQSDWALAGRKQGFDGRKVTRQEMEAAKAARDEMAARVVSEGRTVDNLTPEEQAQWDGWYNILDTYFNEGGGGVPSAPYVTGDGWYELAMRRMVRWASEHGFDEIAWTTGKMQAERYNLAKYYETISYLPESNTLIARPRGGNNAAGRIEEIVAPEKLQDFIGKDLADRLLSAPVETQIMTDGSAYTYHRISGNDLVQYPQGKDALYDTALPSYAKKFGKKYGAEVRQRSIPTSETGYVTQDAAADLNFWWGETVESAPETRLEYVWSLPITDRMREAALQGMPLFQNKKAAIRFLEDNRAILYAFEGADASSVAHEMGHLFRKDLEDVAKIDPQSAHDLRLAEEQLGVVDGKWTVEAEEKFAKGFEVYLGSGQAPTPELANVFARFKRWLADIYGNIREALGVNISEEMRGVFDRLLAEVEAEPALIEQTLPIKPTKLPEAKPGIIGNEVQAWSDPERIYDFRYEIVELDDLIPSNRVDGSVNPQYPAELQPRDRTQAASVAQVDRIAQNLQPVELLQNGNALDRGPMLVGPDNVVESGNGRTIALQKANDAMFAAYRQALTDVAAQYGLDPGQLASMRKPVLVRRRLTDVNRALFAQEANSAVTMQMNTGEVARMQAGILNKDLLMMLQMGGARTLGDALTLRRNNNFVRAFLSKLPPNESAAFVDAGGKLTQSGVEAIRSALFAKIYGQDKFLVDNFIMSATPDLANIGNGLDRSMANMAQLQALIDEGVIDPAFALADDISKVAREIIDIRNGRSSFASVDERIAQMGLFDDMSQAQKMLLRMFDENIRSGKAIGDILNAYAEMLIKQGGAALEDTMRLTKEEVLRDAIRGPQMTLFQDMPDANPPTGAEASSTILNDKLQDLDALQEAIGQRLQEGLPFLNREDAANLIDQLDQTVPKALADAKLIASKTAGKIADDIQLNYGDRRNIDNWLLLAYPYTYWYSRTAWNWLQRFMRRPGMLLAYARMQKYIEDERKKDPALRSRFYNRIKIPLPDGTMQKFGATGFADELYMQNPIESLLPFQLMFPETDWNDPAQVEGLINKLYVASKSLGMSMHPPIDWAMNQRLGQPQPGIKSMIPAAEALSAASALAQPLAPNIIPPGGFMFGPTWGEWDAYRLNRMLASMAADEMAIDNLDYGDPKDVLDAALKLGRRDVTPLLPYLDVQRKVEAWIQGRLTPDEIAELRRNPLAADAMQRAGVERAIPVLSSFFTSIGLTPIAEGEKHQVALQRSRNAVGYQGPVFGESGSRANIRAIDEAMPEQQARIAQYGTIPGEEEQTAENVYWNMWEQSGKDATNKEYDSYVTDLITKTPANHVAFNELRDRRREALDAIDAQIPTDEKEPRLWSIVGANPQEVTQIRSDQITYELWKSQPQVNDYVMGEDGEPDWDAWNADREAWYEQLPQLAKDNELIQLALQDLPANQRNRMLAALTSPENMDAYSRTFDDPLEALHKTIWNLYREPFNRFYDDAEKKYGKDIQDRQQKYYDAAKKRFGDDVFDRQSKYYDEIQARYGENIWDVQSGYFDAGPKGSQARRNYLERHPILKKYWDESDALKKKYQLAVWLEVKSQYKERYRVGEFMEAKGKLYANELSDYPLFMGGPAVSFIDDVMAVYPEKDWTEQELQALYATVADIPYSERIKTLNEMELARLEAAEAAGKELTSAELVEGATTAEDVVAKEQADAEELAALASEPLEKSGYKKSGYSRGYSRRGYSRRSYSRRSYGGGSSYVKYRPRLPSYQPRVREREKVYIR